MSLEHFAQRRPPFGPVLLYGVTVNRLLHISQFSNWPGVGRDLSYIISVAMTSSSPSGSPVRLALRRANSLDCLIFCAAADSARLRFFFCSGVSFVFASFS